MKNVKKFPGYTISADGVIKNKYNKIMKSRMQSRGYLEIGLTYAGKQTFKLVHRLVAETYIDNPQGYPQIDHKDMDKTNNSVHNLRWCTDEMNKSYKPKKERKPRLTMEEHINKTGKPIIVDGKQFISCGSAAKYIMDNVVDRPLAKKSAISKELRKYLAGKKSSWVLYGQFTIGY